MKLDIPEETRANQARASDPTRSAWVSANAGSGKTFVLTQRVVRLLLRGVEPSRILCLTYTKAAAAEMSIRVFRDLSNWALLPDAELRAEISKIEAEAPSASQIERARTLFARALETPGGLKIQTIHAFCEKLLHQFPLEANVPARFEVVQDERQSELMHAARTRTLVAARQGKHRALTAAFEAVLEHGTDHAIEAAFAEAIAARDRLLPWMGDVPPDAMGGHARTRFGLAPDADADTLIAEWHGAQSGPLARLKTYSQAALGGSKTDAERAQPVLDAFAAADPRTLFEACEPLLLTAKGEPRKALYTQKIVPKDDAPFVDALMADYLAARERVRLVQLIDGTQALFTLARDFLADYDAAKRREGLLDFDDLVAATCDLLERKDAAHWIHYKLDRGIEHVLVDEAQDTSPRQWRIIRKLVEEFFTGEGAWEPRREGDTRTVFAVGDEKQSIYSFQGARPEAFAEQRRLFERDMRQADAELQVVPLALSFRSTRDVLGAVDRVFETASNADGLTFDAPPKKHTSVRGDERGQVDIWPLVLRHEARPPEPRIWTDPLDAPEPEAAVLARQIADRIATWLREGEMLEGEGRPIRAGDIMVLVRARDRFVPALTAELKAARVPVAGADRLSLADHIAVQDLLALARVVLLPADDLSLAAVAKSPLFGMSEETLFAIANPRGDRSLMDAMRDHEEGRAVAQRFDELIARLGTMRPYEFFARILGPDGGRRAIFGRLGPQVEDVLDGFLQAALDHEREGTTTLAGFVEAFSRSAAEVKREMDAGRDEVRIMTVHGAKGLEAPVVFLVDKNSDYRGGGAGADQLYRYEGGGNFGEGYLWVPKSDRHTSHTRAIKDDLATAALHEHRRLLYVAMTRAADRLVVCGYSFRAEPAEHSWHAVIQTALEPDAVETPDGLLWRMPDDRSEVRLRAEPETRLAVPAPDVSWNTPLPPEPDELPAPLTASGALALVDADDLRGPAPASLQRKPSGPSGADALRRGTLVHRLLQTLPDVAPEDREAIARRFIDGRIADEDDTVRRVLAIIETHRDLFGPDSRAEVPVMGRVEVAGSDRMISGQIDRLVVTDTTVTIADFKTGGFVPDTAEQVSEAYLRQLALYRELVARLYPDRTVRAVLVWTHARPEPRIMPITPSLLDGALVTLALP